MDIGLKEIGEIILSEAKKNSFFWGVWVTLAIFFVLQTGTITINSPLKQDYWMCSTTNISCNAYLAYPDIQNWDYKAVAKSITEKGDCINVEIYRINGQEASGLYCFGDEIHVGNLVVNLIEIKPSLVNPIHIQYYSILDISWIIIILLIGIPFFIMYRKYHGEESERKRKEKEVKEKQLAKKLKISENDFQELKNIIKEELEQ